MQEETLDSLIDAATEASRNSYSPYSNFPVGAAVLTDSGRIYSGTNIENASYGATVCAASYVRILRRYPRYPRERRSRSRLSTFRIDAAPIRRSVLTRQIKGKKYEIGFYCNFGIAERG